MMQYNNWAIHHFHLESGMLNSDLLCYHEIGHNFQESWDSTSGYPGRWNPKGTGEVTNLIFGKMVTNEVIYSIGHCRCLKAFLNNLFFHRFLGLTILVGLLMKLLILDTQIGLLKT